MKIVLVTGGFDPLHSGHLSYFNAAKQLGDILVVALNSDSWLARKKGQPFLPFSERLELVRNLRMVDMVIESEFNDSDGSSKDAIRRLREHYPNDTIIFANGGDRTSSNIPEMDIVDNNLEFVFGIGGENKQNSSSQILEDWKTPKVVRPWGWYRVLDDQKTYKVKELVIFPGCKLSMQRHFKRSEHWYILKGQCKIQTIYYNTEMTSLLLPNCSYSIGPNVWHRGINDSSEPCHVLEVQYGEICVEEDIERQ